MAEKRVFLGFEVMAPWPHSFPAGRLLDWQVRHMTVAFIGQVDWQEFALNLQSMPLPPFKVGLAGWFSAVHFLPRIHPRVVAWEVSWLENPQPLLDYQQQLTDWLWKWVHPAQKWLPHVTLCRQPFQREAWQTAFQPLPLMCGSLHVYESCANLHYRPIWTHRLILPFEEIDHTADIAFLLSGHTPQQLYTHAQLALAFTCPALVPFLQSAKLPELATKTDIVMALSEIIAKADGEIGIPFKGISLHGQLIQKNDLLTWEMIVDV